MISEKGLIALKESIKHWEINATPGRFDGIGTYKCALCRLYNNRGVLNYCLSNDGEMCPVQQKTGISRCRGTPYNYVAVEYSPSFEDERAPTPEFHDASQLMVDFLKSLLPETESK